MDSTKEEAPPGYEWQDVKSYDENGKAIFKRELVKLQMVGGPTEVQDANEEIKQIATGLKEEVEKQTKKTFKIFEAVKFTTQVVNGIMYRIKVKIGDNEYIHLRAIKNLPAKGGNVVFKNVDEGFKLEDPLN